MKSVVFLWPYIPFVFFIYRQMIVFSNDLTVSDRLIARVGIVLTHVVTTLHIVSWDRIWLTCAHTRMLGPLLWADTAAFSSLLSLRVHRKLGSYDGNVCRHDVSYVWMLTLAGCLFSSQSRNETPGKLCLPFCSPLIPSQWTAKICLLMMVVCHQTVYVAKASYLHHPSAGIIRVCYCSWLYKYLLIYLNSFTM